MRDLQSAILRHATGSVTPTAITGLTLYRADQERSATIPFIYKPMVCILAQGEKSVLLGARSFRYTSAHYLLSSVDLPVRSAVLRAAPGKPYLSASLELDAALLHDISLQVGAAPRRAAPVCGLALGRPDAALALCFERLVSLLDTPEHIEHLAPLMRREIFYRLLRGAHGAMLEQVCASYSRSAKVAQAIRSIRDHFREPFSARGLARTLHMSEASLNRHFRTVTAMSPLQYQKQMRLQEARRLLLSEEANAASTAVQVGYTSPSQFSREYARVFGNPPRTDAARLRTRPEQARQRRQPSHTQELHPL